MWGVSTTRSVGRGAFNLKSCRLIEGGGLSRLMQGYAIYTEIRIYPFAVMQDEFPLQNKSLPEVF